MSIRYFSNPLRRRPKTAQVVETLRKLRGEQVVLRMENPRQLGMAIHYMGHVGDVEKLPSKRPRRWWITLENQAGNPIGGYEISKINRIEIDGPYQRSTSRRRRR